MKKIINMKRYDTTTAEEIFTSRNEYSSSDFDYCRETLYLTKNKSWFLHGEGGADSSYAKFDISGRSSSPGSDITPLTEAEAAAWLADRSALEFDKHFAHFAKDA